MPNRDEKTWRQDVAQQKRHWVRLTRRCNNRCVFCHDSGAQDGSYLSMDDARQVLADGRDNGAVRAILSGGEPTIHPRFVQIVKLAHDLGYRWIQVVTNGRMLSYQSFLEDCLDAGLSEITFSLPAHQRDLFNRIVGVRNGFEQSLAGLKNALADGRPVVSVDIVACKENVSVLPDIVAFYLSLGVREFDLLQIVPFGRAYDPDRGLDASQLFDRRKAAPIIQRAIDVGLLSGAVMWTNRMDPELLEGFEGFIQDPIKLADEVHGRFDDLQHLASGGTMSCEDEQRCRFCFLRRYCAHLVRLRDLLTEQGGRHLWIGVSGDALKRALHLIDRHPAVFAGIWLQARQVDEAMEILAAIDATNQTNGTPTDTILDMQDWGEHEHNIDDLITASMVSRRIVMARFHRAEDLESVLKLAAHLGTKAVTDDAPSSDEHQSAATPIVLAMGINKQTEPLLRAPYELQGRVRPTSGVSSVDLFIEERVLLGDLLSTDVDPRGALSHLAVRTLDAQEGDVIRFEAMPPCLSHQKAIPAIESIPASVLDDDGVIDPQAFVSFHIATDYRIMSFRCDTCTHRSTCPGLPITTARAFGLGILKPMDNPK